MTTVDQFSLPAALRTLRRERGLTLAQLGARINRPGSTIAQWESGRHEPRAGQLMAWARALGYEVGLYEPCTPAEIPVQTAELLNRLIDVLAGALNAQDDNE